MSATRRRVTGAVLREETIRRLGGMGDDFHMTWTADDRMLMALCDGVGWDEPPTRMYNSCLHEVIGGPEDARFERVEGYPELVNLWEDPKRFSRYYGFGTIALEDTIYQYLSTPNVSFLEVGPRFVGAKLIYSPDSGTTWHNQDGSTPVVWEDWGERSSDNMVFFFEPHEAFSMISILQMGRNYEHNTDGYVYGYGPNGNVDGRMNELVMFRVREDSILQRGSYEFFAGLRGDGDGEWTTEIQGRTPIHTFPDGYVNKTIHPWSWLPSVAYNAALNSYMMVNAGTGVGPEGVWFGKPSYFGIYVADTPWGPWTQIHEEVEWTPEGDAGARTYSPTIPPKWIAEDGRSFWMTWGDFQSTVRPDPEPITIAESLERAREHAASMSFEEHIADFKRKSPYYGFNLQRVDLTVE
jgi:hypothetical protein